jgi:hypothetical protein
LNLFKAAYLALITEQWMAHYSILLRAYTFIRMLCIYHKEYKQHYSNTTFPLISRMHMPLTDTANKHKAGSGKDAHRILLKMGVV